MSRKLSPHVAKKVQQSLPFGPLAPRRVLPLAADHIQPVVRIAHRIRFPLEIPERIIFDHEFVFILAGAGELVLGSEHCPYQPHDLLFIPPFLPHYFCARAGQAGDHVAVHFDFAAQMGGLDDELDQRAPYEIRLAPSLYIPRRQFVPPGGPLEQALLNLVCEQASADPLAGLRTTRDMLSALTSVLSSQEEGQPPSPVTATQARNQTSIQRVIALIRANLHRPLDAVILAQAADMSVSRMNTVFGR